MANEAPIDRGATALALRIEDAAEREAGHALFALCVRWLSRAGSVPTLAHAYDVLDAAGVVGARP